MKQSLISAALPPATYQRLIAQAAAEGCTRSMLVRRAIEQYLSQEPARVSPGRIWELDCEADQSSFDIRRQQAPIIGPGE